MKKKVITKEKGNFLESIVEMLEKSFSDEKTIIEKNKKIIDLDGIEREIDIYIEGHLNKRRYITIIECKNYDYPINIEKIEAFYSKCSRLPNIDKKIFLTTSNYQSGAVAKAKSFNIELYKITKEKFVPETNPLDISKVYIPRKECDILAIRYNSKELYNANVIINESLHLYFKNGDLITNQFFMNILENTPQIWRYLNTNSGFLYDYKKIIYANFKLNNIYTKVNDIFYLVDSIRVKIQIEIQFNELKINELKNYKALDNDINLATFSDIEFISNDEKYTICFIKPEEDEKPVTFLKIPNKAEVIKLDYLGELKENSNKNTPSFYNNVDIKTYQINVGENVINNIPLSNIKEDKSFFNDKKRKSNIYLAIETPKNKMFFMIPFLHNNKLITGRFPEPISLYFNHSIDLYNQSEKLKSLLVIEDNKNEINLINDNDYHRYIQNYVSSIFMLNSAIELFLNSCIDDNFETNLDKKIITKFDFQNFLTLEDKVKLTPKYSKFSPNRNKKIVNSILKLFALNQDLQNLKTSDDKVHQPFLQTFEDLLKFDMKECLENTKIFFKKVNPTFIIDDL